MPLPRSSAPAPLREFTQLRNFPVFCLHSGGETLDATGFSDESREREGAFSPKSLTENSLSDSRRGVPPPKEELREEPSESGNRFLAAAIFPCRGAVCVEKRCDYIIGTAAAAARSSGSGRLRTVS